MPLNPRAEDSGNSSDPSGPEITDQLHATRHWIVTCRGWFSETLCHPLDLCKAPVTFAMPLRHLFSKILLLAICSDGIASAAEPSAPAAPSNLKVTAVGVNAFKLKWKDNSNNELGWEIKVSLKGGPPKRYLILPTKDITSYTLFTNDLPGFGLVFQMTAYNGASGAELFSDPTEIVTVTAQSPNKFDAPSGLTAKQVDDGRVRLGWVDNSTSESGYQIQFKAEGDKKWTTLGTVQPELKFNVVASGLLPAKKYLFRVRAYKGTTLATAYSNTADVTTKGLQAPVKLEVTPDVEGGFKFKWKDRSSVESGFELQQKVGGEDFTSPGTFAANTENSGLITGFTLDSDIQFRVRAYRLDGTTRTYSKFSNIFETRSTALAKPTGLAVTARTDASITLGWADNSKRESSYQIQYRKTGSTEFKTQSAAADAKSLAIAGLDAGTDYEFRIRAVSSGFFTPTSFSPLTGLVTGRTKDGVGGNLNPILSLGVPFSYQVHVTNTALLTGVTVTGLPAELSFDPNTRTISGKVAKDASYTLTVTATFSDGTSSIRTVTIRSSTPPVVLAPFASTTVAVAGTSVVSVSGKFSDPDTLSAARFETSKGQFDIILFPTAAPLTVDNFLDYIDAGEYDNMFFHRSPPGFVLQGGGYKHTIANGFSEVAKFDSVLNEPGISNRRGTVAMAKIGGQPNSATSEWFVNLADNSGGGPSLDTQNGGFTVFGRIPDKGMILFNAIGALPIRDYNITTPGGVRSLEDVPIDAAAAPVVLDPAKLVKVLTVGPAPILSYTVSSQNTAIATAALSGTDITITGVAKGTTNIEVKATDLDGNPVTQNIGVTVQ